MNDESDSENPTAISDRWQPPRATRFIALGYMVVAAVAVTVAWVNFADASELDVLIWLPAAVLLTGVCLFSVVGTLLLWRSTGIRATGNLYAFCVAFGALAAVPFLGLPIIAAGAAIVLAGPAIAILVLLTRTDSGHR